MHPFVSKLELGCGRVLLFGDKTMRLVHEGRLYELQKSTTLTDLIAIYGKEQLEIWLSWYTNFESIKDLQDKNRRTEDQLYWILYAYAIHEYENTPIQAPYLGEE